MDPTPTRILTIGSSCINRFQFDFFQDRHPDTQPHFIKSLFDWNISSLVGTETVLRLAAENRLLPILQDGAQFHVVWDVLIFHRQLPGFCFYHETELAQALDRPGQRDVLIGKVLHQAAPLLQPDHAGRTHLIWSNIQPNLPDTVDNVTPWDSFRLTARRHATIKALGRDLFGPDTTFSFLSTAEDVSADLAHEDDVQIVPLARGDTYSGPPDLFEKLLANIVQQTQV